MWTCPKCRLINPDTSTLCDCGKETVADTGGGLSPIPVLVWIHSGLVALLTLYLAYSDLTRGPRRYHWQPSENQQRIESGLFWLRTIVLIPLYLAFISRRNWARIAVGVITLPLGLLLLVPRSVRQYTGAIPEEPTPGRMLGLDKE
jgi:hypothetical protein